MKSLTRKLNGKEESAYGLAGLGDLYVSSAGGRNSKMGYYLGQGHLFNKSSKVTTSCTCIWPVYVKLERYVGKILKLPSEGTL